MIFGRLERQSVASGPMPTWFFENAALLSTAPIFIAFTSFGNLLTLSAPLSQEQVVQVHPQKYPPISPAEVATTQLPHLGTSWHTPRFSFIHPALFDEECSQPLSTPSTIPGPLWDG
jgi:hypothetical protein